MPNLSDVAQVSKITVHCQSKAWSADSRKEGQSGETTITWELLPKLQSWTPEEARVITLLARKELQRLLLADARARQVPEPDSGVDSLNGYDEAIAAFTSKV